MQQQGLRRKVEKSSRTLKGEGARSPMQRAYNDALELRALNPELAIRKFQALVDLYGGEPGEEDDYVVLAREELDRLEKQLAQDIQADSKVVEAQLAEADRLAPSDRAAAHRMRQAVITLYGEKPWAGPLVERARQALAEESPAGSPQGDR